MDEISYELLRKFVVPEIVFGRGARFLVANYAGSFAIRRPLVVTDEGVLAAGWPDDVLRALKEADISTVVFSDVTSNPKDHEVMGGVEKYLAGNCDGIIAVGGGSPMDCAKGIGIVVSNKGHIRDYEGADQVPIPCPPLICVPTTAGTSADVSQFAIITDTSKHKKMAMVSKALVPDVALVDPATTHSMDPALTAATGMDALVHATEALVSNASSPLTDLHALEAANLVSRHLEKAFVYPESCEHRDGMMYASLFAGMAFSNASLGAIHAMAHSIGGLKDAPHGECNAILLPLVMSYNWNYADSGYLRLGRALGLIDDKTDMAAAEETIITGVRRLMESIGIPHNFARWGLDKRDIPALVEYALADPCMVTNPRPATREEIENVYAQAI